jgi:signal transduction histidine kinase
MTERETTEQAGRVSSLVAKAIFALLLVVTATSVVFHIRGVSTATPPTGFGPRGFAIFFTLTFSVVGALLASKRPGLPFGWVFLAAGIIAGFQDLGDSYAHFTLRVRQATTGLALFGVWIEYWIWTWLVGLIVLVLAFLFPSGEFLSRKWRTVFWITVVLTFISGVAQALHPEALEDAAKPNPVRIPGDQQTIGNIGDAMVMLLVVALLLGVVAVAVRFRRSAGDERRQLLWLLAAISAVFSGLLIYGITEILRSSGVMKISPTHLFFEALEVAMILSIGSIPMAAGAAILKYRLYSIEVAVNRAVVYGALAVLVTLIYGLAVLLPAVVIFGLGGGQLLLPLIATAIIALAVQPLRRSLQRFANRLVYGERLSPYEAMADLSQRMAGELSIDEVLPRLAETAAKGVGATKSRVVLIMPGGDARAAAWPTNSQDGAYQHTVPVTHKGERVGEISVAKTAAESIAPAEKRLLEDLASQAGLALANVRLTEDLRASRRRIVSAQDEERRRLERDLHDGAQQHLVALKLKIGLAEKLTQTDPVKASEMLSQLGREADETLQNVRDLARGIFPPLLADQGIAAALNSQIPRISAQVEVIDQGIGRHAREIEAAVYFCCLEALQNVSKYAQASGVTIRLWLENRVLHFKVEDNGVGFDASKSRAGSGLQNMRDRVEAIGGDLTIDSSVGGGTRVEGRVPASAVEAVAAF